VNHTGCSTTTQYPLHKRHVEVPNDRVSHKHDRLPIEANGGVGMGWRGRGVQGEQSGIGRAGRSGSATCIS
jgi:hypothetical protein